MTSTPSATWRRKKRRRGRADRTPWLDPMAAPALLILAAVIAYPIVEAVRLSFTDYNLVSGQALPVGMDNYSKLGDDPVFLESLRHTAVFTGVSVIAAMALGLGLALALEDRGGPWRLVRSAMLTPWAVPIIVVAFLFRHIFERDGGVLNHVLLGVGLLDERIGWLTSSTWAMPAVIVANVWSQTPFFLLLFMAGLAGIPTAVIEAARIDRLRGWSLIRLVKLPYLRNAAVVGALLMTINNFNNFPLIWSMTQGGPAYNTTTLVVYVYRLAFTKFDLGYASAVGAIWLLALLALAVWFIRMMRGDAR